MDEKSIPSYFCLDAAVKELIYSTMSVSEITARAPLVRRCRPRDFAVSDRKWTARALRH